MRGGLKLLLGLVVILAIIWVGLWWYAEGQMEAGATTWTNRLTSQGWKVSYDNDRRGTSPLAATLTLTNLTLSPPADPQGRNVVVTLPALTWRVDAFNPLVLHTDLPNKINIDIGSQIDAAITFGSITETQRLDPHLLFSHQNFPFRGGDTTATNINVLGSQGSLLVLHIDGLNARFAVDRTAGAGQTAAALSEDFTGIAVAPLMTKVLSIPFDGKINHVGFGFSVSGPVPADFRNLIVQVDADKGDLPAQRQLIVPAVHVWAAAGGNGRINLNLILGPTTLNAGGTVKFDKTAQPSGTADVTANHLDELTTEITSAYPQAQDQIAQIEARLSPYLTTSSADGQVLAMHVIYGNGAVNVNGQKVGPLPPVDWEAVQNPTAAPAN